VRSACGLILGTLCLATPGESGCSTPPQVCTADADCFNGQACVGKKCQAMGASCGTDANCPSGQICAVGGSHTCQVAASLTCAEVQASEGWGWNVCETTVPVCQGVGVATSDCNHCCECLLDTDCAVGDACLLDTHTCVSLSSLSCPQLAAHQGWSDAICQRAGENQCGDSGDATAGCDYCCECEAGSDCPTGTVCLPTTHLCADARELTCDDLAVASGWNSHACQLPGSSPACSSVGRQTIDCTFCCCTGVGCE
jgi:hypothetical protein